MNLLQNKYVDFASSLYTSTIDYQVKMDGNGNKSIFESSDRGTGFNLLLGDSEIFYSTNKINGLGEELSGLTNQLNSINRNTRKIKQTENSDNNVKSTGKVEIDISDSGVWVEDYEETIDDFLKNIVHVIRPHTNLRFSFKLGTQFIQKRYQSSLFNDLIQKYTLSLLEITVYSKNSPLTRTEVIGGISKSDLKWENVENKIVELITSYNSLIRAKRPKFGKYDLLLSPDAAYSFVHETVGHACEGDQIISGDSFLSNQMGYKVASSLLTIVDDPHLRGVGWGEFDDEGTKTQGTILVDEGILTGFLHDNKTAKKFGQLSTGNARSSGYLSPPTSRQSNLYIEPKDLSIEELLELVGNGLMIGPTHSASTSIFTGDYSVESQISYKIKNGEIADVLGPVTLTGNAIHSLQNVNGIGNQPELFPTICLKKDNKVNVGAFTPSLSLTDSRIH